MSLHKSQRARMHGSVFANAVTAMRIAADYSDFLFVILLS